MVMQPTLRSCASTTPVAAVPESPSPDVGRTRGANFTKPSRTATAEEAEGTRGGMADGRAGAAWLMGQIQHLYYIEAELRERRPGPKLREARPSTFLRYSPPPPRRCEPRKAGPSSIASAKPSACSKPAAATPSAPAQGTRSRKATSAKPSATRSGNGAS